MLSTDFGDAVTDLRLSSATNGCHLKRTAAKGKVKENVSFVNVTDVVACRHFAQVYRRVCARLFSRSDEGNDFLWERRSHAGMRY